jgi:hypothetical protein
MSLLGTTLRKEENNHNSATTQALTGESYGLDWKRFKRCGEHNHGSTQQGNYDTLAEDRKAIEVETMCYPETLRSAVLPTSL